MARVRFDSLYLIALGLLCAGAAVYVLTSHSGQNDLQAQVRTVKRLDQIPFDGQQAFEYLSAICAIGPRVSGTPGMAKQQKMLTEHFEKHGGKVDRQEFITRHPLDGSAVPMCNLIVSWHPQRKRRYLLCAHYDTRPFPDRDPQDPRGEFVGANDGASGVALLMELAKHIPDMAGSNGVDIVLFDGEELIYNERTDKYFLGSEHFAKEHVANKNRPSYRHGILLDMVAGADLRLYMEGNSMKFAPRQAGELWLRAEKLGVRDFVRQVKHTVNDDHIPLNEIARIPTFDVIDFDYPHWHTMQDKPENCSALSLAKVGWVLLDWLKIAVR
jgi:glutaminyl-peptide cyclotransferase